MEEPGRLQSMGLLSRTPMSDFNFTFHFHALEKEMAPHSKCSCLENPRDGGAWLAAIYGVAQSDLAAAAAMKLKDTCPLEEKL